MSGLDWTDASLVMFCASVAMYLFIRRGQRQRIPLLEYMLAMFLLPLVGYGIAVGLGSVSLALSIGQIGMIALAAVSFYLGTLFSQESILLTSNPGYSLIIAKSYVVITTVFAAIFFQSHLTHRTVFAILLILAFSAVMSIEKRGKAVNVGDHKRIILAVVAAFCYAALALLSTYVLKRDMNVVAYLFYLFLVMNIFVVGEILVKKVHIVWTKRRLPTLVFIGIASMLFNLFMQLGYKLAPNPGYINAVSVASIALITILSAVFFKDELTGQKIVGVLGVTAGLVVLLL